VGLGKVGLTKTEICFSQDSHALVSYCDAIHSEYALYYLSTAVEIFKYRNRGTTINGVTKKQLFDLPFKLPPLAEQHRIVAKIEELFSDLDAGIASLKQAQAQLKTYRQAVLKYAFEGKLTAEWRAQHKPEPVEKLLAQIKAEREKQYQQQLAEWQKASAGGKDKKKPSKPQKPKEFPALTEAELTELPELPEGWRWVKLGNLSMGVEYGSAKKSKEEGKIPVIRMGNLQNGVIVWDDSAYTEDEDEINQYLLRKDDVLFNRTNSPELVGKTAIYKGERPAIFAGYLIRINQVPDVDARYLNYFLNSHIAKNHGNRVKTDGVNQSNINGEKLCHYPFPLVSGEEQHQIVQEIESRLSVCDKLEESIKESLQKAEALRQSILKKAFEGRLVAQDPNDEPAEKLLARIREEKNKTQTS
jgi:type I restriction enzyme S subunit